MQLNNPAASRTAEAIARSSDAQGDRLYLRMTQAVEKRHDRDLDVISKSGPRFERAKGAPDTARPRTAAKQ